MSLPGHAALSRADWDTTAGWETGRPAPLSACQATETEACPASPQQRGCSADGAAEQSVREADHRNVTAHVPIVRRTPLCLKRAGQQRCGRDTDVPNSKAQCEPRPG